MSSDTHKRSIAKAISWRVTGTVDTFLLSWLITGELLLATGIAGSEVLTKVTLFYFHERLWARVRWGRKEDDRAASPVPEKDATTNLGPAAATV